MNPNLRRIQRHLHQHARRRPAQPIEHLMRIVTDSVVIDEAWRQVRTAGGANTPGADRLTAKHLAADPAGVSGFLQDLADKLQSGEYRPGPVLRYEMPKPGRPDKKRPIAILTLKDRVVHMALKIVLEPIVEAQLDDRAFGFRPNLSRFDQVHTVRDRLIDHPELYRAAVSADIASCFDQLDHRLILEDFRAQVADDDALKLFRLVLEQVGNGKSGWLNRRRVGVLQGSPLSPLLANWNLARFDRAWRGLHGERAPMFRYADDLLILARDLADADRLRHKAAECLHRTNRLALADGKTHIRTITEGLPLLGLVLKRHHDPFLNRDEVSIFTDTARFQEVVAEIDRCLDSLDPARSLGAQFDQLNKRLRGWFEALQFAYDAPQAFEAIDRHVSTGVRRNSKVLPHCSVTMPRQDHERRVRDGHETWQAEGVALLVLSSLPRRRYRPSAAPLPWEAGQDEDHEPYEADESPVVLTRWTGSRFVRVTDGRDQVDPVLDAMMSAAAPVDTVHGHGDGAGSRPRPRATDADRQSEPTPEATGDDRPPAMNPTVPEEPEHAA